MADDEDVVWLYNPSFALAVFATIIYGISFLWIFYLTVIKYRAWFFVCVVVGSAIEVVGYAIRCYSAKAKTEIGPFAATLSLIVLAPIFVAAGNYLLIGRIIRSVLPASHHRVFRVPAHLLTRIFVICDIISFLIQCSGSGVASSNNWVGEEERIGTKILIAGLSFQVFTFCAYMCIFGRFHYLARTMAVPEAPRGWMKVVTAVYVSSLLILVRSIYRVVEFAEGVWGYPFTHEWLFWVFEALPMIIAITIFCPYHPSKYLGRDGRKKEGGSEEIGMSDDAHFA